MSEKEDLTVFIPTLFSDMETTRILNKRVSSSPFDLLPDEILLEILSRLSPQDLAVNLFPIPNKRFRRLCRDKTLCGKIRVDKRWDLDTARRVVQMAGQGLVDLTLESSSDQRVGIFALERCPNLQRLKCNWGVSDDLMTAMSKSSSLTWLALGEENKDDDKDEEEEDIVQTHLAETIQTMRQSVTLALYASCLRNITVLDLTLADLNDDLWLLPIADNCSKLEQILMPESVILREDVFKYLLDKVRGTLKGLSVYGDRLTDSSYKNLRKCDLLVYLDIYCAAHLGPEGLKAISDLSPTLQRLTISTASFTGLQISQVFDEVIMDKMVYLDLYECVKFDDVGLEALAKSCPNLKKLYLTNCASVGDRGVVKVLERCEESLVDLCLSGTKVTAKAFREKRRKGQQRRGGLNLRELHVDVGIRKELGEIMPRTCKIVVEKSN